MFDIFRLFDIFHRGYNQRIDHLSKQISFFHLFSFLTYPYLSYFCVLALVYIMVKDIGRLYKYNQPKISTPTLKQPVSSSSAAHSSSTSNLTRTSISYQLDNKDSTTNQNKNNTSNADGIHSYVTPRKKITVSRPHLHPLV